MDQPDQNIINRLKNQPPYGDEPVETAEGVLEYPPKEEVVETETTEEPKEVEEPVEEPKEEVKVEPSKEEETKKRTQEQFEKLKEHNNNLKKENENLKLNVLDSLRAPINPPVYTQPTTNVVPTKDQFPGLTQQQIKNTFEGLIDEQGYVDTGLLISTLSDQRDSLRKAEERATQAEQRAKKVEKTMDDFERNAIMRRVHKKYPKLNPENKNFDERLWEGVRNEVIGQWTRGQQENVEEAAEKWSKILYGEEKPVTKKEKQQVEETETAKRNINALGAKQAPARLSPEEMSELVKGVREGKRGALAERLKRSGY